MTKEKMLTFGLSDKTLSNYDYEGFRILSIYFTEHHEEYYSKEIIDNLVFQARKQYELSLINRSKYQNIRKVAAMMDECFETGTVNWSCLPNWYTKKLNKYFEKILSLYLQNKIESSTYSIGTLKGHKVEIRQFLLYLEGNGHKNFSNVTLEDVNRYISFAARTHPSGMGNIISILRVFGQYLNEKQLMNVDMVPVLMATIPKRRKIHDGFTESEAENILSTVNRETPCGKRDYAILTLAKNTGLRAIDISNLKYSNIDWNNNEIQIIQHKTNKPLLLPLEPVVGNSIVEYILNGRPKSDSLYIFLRSSPPYEKLRERSVSAIASRYIKRSGVQNDNTQRKGMHSFRRYVGAKMLEAEVPLSLISEFLGHSNIDSSKPYLSTNERQLKECALELCGIEVSSEELQ